MIHYYGMAYKTIAQAMIASALSWLAGALIVRKKLWTILNIPVVGAALAVIVYCTVWGRSMSGEHRFVLANAYSNDFYREMIMNVFLYYPLGLSLTAVLGPQAVLAAFCLSLGIETWQYAAGTGLAQGTDILCNTLGCALGAVPWLLDRGILRLYNRRMDRKKPQKNAIETKGREE